MSQTSLPSVTLSPFLLFLLVRERVGLLESFPSAPCRPRAVVVFGDTAVLAAVAVDQVERDGRQESYRLRLTQTWIRDHGQWRCLSGHASPRI
jgi:hypothetical protein